MSTDPARAAELPAETVADSADATPRAAEADGRPPAGGRPARGGVWAWTTPGLAIVFALAWVTRYLEQNAPEWFADTSAADVVAAIEYPVYAIVLGLLGGLVITLTGIRDRVSGAFRTEFFIKTGLVLLGASVNLSVIVNAAGPATVQALLLVTSVFFFAWWLGGR